MKIMSIVGARPQFIKCAPLSKELRKTNIEVLVHTGQHYDYQMSEVFFSELHIPHPDYNLGVGSGSHGYQVGKMLMEIENLMVNEKPDMVIVYGDTNSTLSGALAAVKLNIKVAHIEAGLRSNDTTMPEEINRVLVDRCATLLFCPSQVAKSNLAKEGIVNGVNVVGDIMVDVLMENKEIASHSDILERIGVLAGNYYVLTIHRQGNTDDAKNLRDILDACLTLDKPVIFPAHPRTLKMMKEAGVLEKVSHGMIVIEPLGYLDFLKLQSCARKVLTDSGGIQKEAFILGVPCITLRNNTEWVETLEGGWNTLVGVNKERIISAAQVRCQGSRNTEVYGSGVAKKIVHIIMENKNEMDG